MPRPLSHRVSEPSNEADTKALLDELERVRVLLMDRDRLASIGLLMGDIAHEIYNPLAWVKLNESLYRAAFEAFEKDGDAEALRKKLPRLLELMRDSEVGMQRIEDVVGAVRLLSRRQTDARAPEDLNEICQKTVVMLNQTFKKKSIEVTTDWGAVPPVLCNRSGIAQAVMNLIVNAAEAVADGGRIHVRTLVQDANVAIEVADDGAGMTPETLARIFTPFFTTKPLGTGLGLPLVKSVAEEHGGHAEAQNRSQGGALFRITIPLAASPGT